MNPAVDAGASAEIIGVYDEAAFEGHCGWSFDRFDEEAFFLAVVELDDFRKRTCCFLVTAVVHALEPGLEQHFLDELTGEDRLIVAMIDQLDNQLRADAFHRLIGNEKIAPITGLIGGDPFIKSGSPMRKTPPGFSMRRNSWSTGTI